MKAAERLHRILRGDREAWAQPDESVVIGVPEAELRAILAASVDTHPKGRDAKQGSVGTMGSAVDAEGSETPKNPPQSHQ